MFNSWFEDNFEEFYRNKALRKKFLSVKDVVRTRQELKLDMTLEQYRRYVFGENMRKYAGDQVIQRRTRMLSKRKRKFILE